jgi:hypothetical protein
MTPDELIEQRRRRIVEDRVAHAIATFFVRNPNLVGFYLQDPAGFEDAINPPSATALSILDVEISGQPGEKALEEMRQRIRDMLTRVMSERPEAFDMIRDRTFARVFH